MDTGENPASRKQVLTVNLAGIIEIFGKSLYNEFGAIVRELVQNGHDAVLEDYVDHAAAGKTLLDYWVNVRFDSVARVLIVSDNGTGMNDPDVSKELGDFARPRKVEIRSHVASVSPEQTLYIIGLYGVGFLSALAVSDQVEVWTRKDGSQPILWVYKTGDEFATVSEGSAEGFGELHKENGLPTDQSDQTGTVVICRLSREVIDEYRITAESIRDTLDRYVLLLRVPVYFNGDQINDRSAAWKNPAGATPDDWREMIKETTGTPPLMVIPIYSPPEELDLEGVLWIPERKKILGDNGYIDIYKTNVCHARRRPDSPRLGSIHHGDDQFEQDGAGRFREHLDRGPARGGGPRLHQGPDSGCLPEALGVAGGRILEDHRRT